jgi:chromosome segregation ATPase
LQWIAEEDKVTSEQETKIKEMQREIQNSSKRITELTAEIAKANEGKQKIESELSGTVKKSADFQKNCASVFLKQQESEEEISSLRRTCENLRAQVAEREAIMVMMRDSVSLCCIQQHNTTATKK